MNGQALTTTKSYSGVQVATFNKLRIGEGLDSNDFNGRIDEVRIYSKGLSAMEIQQHYAEGIGRHLADAK